MIWYCSIVDEVYWNLLSSFRSCLKKKFLHILVVSPTDNLLTVSFLFQWTKLKHSLRSVFNPLRDLRQSKHLLDHFVEMTVLALHIFVESSNVDDCTGSVGNKQVGPCDIIPNKPTPLAILLDYCIESREVLGNVNFLHSLHDLCLLLIIGSSEPFW